MQSLWPPHTPTPLPAVGRAQGVSQVLMTHSVPAAVMLEGWGHPMVLLWDNEEAVLCVAAAVSPRRTHIPFGDASPRAERGDFSAQRQTIGMNGANVIYSFIHFLHRSPNTT